MALLLVAAYAGTVVVASVVANVISQLFFPDKSKPPLVFHWIPFLGSTLSYGADPYAFFFSCREKYGDIFTFILLGQKTTVYLGIAGNEFILNGKLADVNAEEVYSALTTPVFGSDVVYDCPNAKLMEQKKFIKFGLTQSALESHVQLIEDEVEKYIATSPYFNANKGTVDISAVMAEITIFTASRALQGDEVRSKLSAEFASLYHDLDKGFSPINFLLPPWVPLPHNRKRDAAHARMRAIYLDIINERRNDTSNKEHSDMIWNLMRCRYRDGKIIPDKEIAHMMITLLMAGQHQSASIGAWIVLRLASETEKGVLDELYREQLDNLPSGGGVGLEYSSLAKLPLHQNVVRETLRLHLSIHSIMRKVKNPLSVTVPVRGPRAAGTEAEVDAAREENHYIIPPNHVLLASPGVTALSEEFFPSPSAWDPHRWDSPSSNKNNEDGDGGEMVDYGYGAVTKGTASPYLPFGAGRHRCIGEKFAHVNMEVILAVLVRHFRFSCPGGSEGWVPRTDYSSLFSRPEEPAFVCWERRSCV